MSAEIIPIGRTIDRTVPFVMHLVRIDARESFVERTAASDRLIEKTAQITLFIDPEVV